MKSFDKILTVIAGLGLIIIFVTLNQMFFNNPPAQQVEASEIAFPDEYEYKDYVITEIKNNGTEILGDSIPNSPYGIYLDATIYTDFPELKELKVGDKIQVVFDKEEYAEGIWDNILDVYLIQ